MSITYDQVQQIGDLVNQLGISQTVIAAKAGVQRITVYRTLKGKRANHLVLAAASKLIKEARQNGKVTTSEASELVREVLS